MWHKEYRDYPLDTPLIQQKRRPGKGIVGCEMHDLNGWGNTLHVPAKPKKVSFVRRWLGYLLGANRVQEGSEQGKEHD